MGGALASRRVRSRGRGVGLPEGVEPWEGRWPPGGRNVLVCHSYISGRIFRVEQWNWVGGERRKAEQGMCEIGDRRKAEQWMWVAGDRWMSERRMCVGGDGGWLSRGMDSGETVIERAQGVAECQKPVHSPQRDSERDKSGKG